jgi:hypothetical protein
MNYFLEPYADLINLLLPLILFFGCFAYISLHIHLVTRVTPRVDKINGYQTTQRFRINLHQSGVYQRCFSASEKQLNTLFKADKPDLWFFRFDKYFARVMLVVIPVGCSFLVYTHSLTF